LSPGRLEWNKISHIGKHNVSYMEDWDTSLHEYSKDWGLHSCIDDRSCSQVTNCILSLGRKLLSRLLVVAACNQIRYITTVL
jgi:hypothetical protein